MKMMIDKIMIECMNEFYGLDLTYASFKKFYIEVVKEVRVSHPDYIKRKKENALIADYVFKALRDDSK